jgi:hypothetical protein
MAEMAIMKDADAAIKTRAFDFMLCSLLTGGKGGELQGEEIPEVAQVGVPAGDHGDPIIGEGAAKDQEGVPRQNRPAVGRMRGQKLTYSSIFYRTPPRPRPRGSRRAISPAST